MLPGWELFIGAGIICAGWIYAIRCLDKRFQVPKIDPDMVKHLREKDEETKGRE